MIIKTFQLYNTNQKKKYYHTKTEDFRRKIHLLNITRYFALAANRYSTTQRQPFAETNPQRKQSGETSTTPTPKR